MPISSFIEKVSGYVKTHERILIVAFVLLTGWFVTGKIDKAVAAYHIRQLAADQAALKVTADHNAQLAAQAQQDNTDLKALTQQFADQNASLEAQNAALVSALAQKQAADKALPPPALAQKIEDLASLPPNSVTPGPGSNFTVTGPAAGQVAATLEEIPALQNELANVSAERNNDAELLVKANTTIADYVTLNQGLNTQLAQADTVCKAEIKVQVDKAKATRRKWFIAGFVVGVATRFAKYL